MPWAEYWLFLFDKKAHTPTIRRIYRDMSSYYITSQLLPYLGGEAIKLSPGLIRFSIINIVGSSSVMSQKVKKPCNCAGKIHRRDSGEYYTRLMLGHKADGTPNRVYVTGKTQKEVTTKRAKLISDFEEGTYVVPSKMTLAELLNEWLYEYKNISLEPRTFDSYESQIRTNINPVIGNLPIKTLTPKRLQKYVKRLRDEFSLSTETISKNLAIIHGSLDYAVLNKYTKTNAAIGVKNFRTESSEVHVFTEEERNLILITSSGKMKDMCTVAFDTGIRTGELLGLMWDAIDLEKGRLYVRKCVVSAKDRAIGKQTTGLSSKLKTLSSRRTVPMTDICKEVFIRLKEQSFQIQYKSNNNGNSSSNLDGSSKRILESSFYSSLSRILYFTLYLLKIANFSFKVH